MKLSIVILEDHPAEARKLILLLNKWAEESNCSIETAEYRSGEEFFQKNDSAVYLTTSLFFLDIQMSGMNGIDAAKKIRSEGYPGPIIFLTAFREYVFRGYEVHAMNYLLKPIKENALFLCLDEIVDQMRGNSYLFKNKQELVSIPFKDILSFLSNGHYVDITTISAYYCQHTTLSRIMGELPAEFIRVHKSCIVNMAHIYKITGSTIVLSNHMTTQIGRSYMQSVVAAFTAYSMRFDM